MGYKLNHNGLLVKALLECPYLPSPYAVIDAALELAQFRKSEIFADLGCGDGTVIIRTAQKYGILSVGFEIDRNMVRVAKRNVKAAGVANLVDVVHSDLFTVDLSKFNVIYIYLSPLVKERLSQKIIDECSKNTRILVHDYPLENLRLNKIVQLRGGEAHNHKIYFYKM